MQHGRGSAKEPHSVAARHVVPGDKYAAVHAVLAWAREDSPGCVIWRGPYINGPADAPLMMGEKAYLVDS